MTVAPLRSASSTCSSILAATGSLLSGPIVVASSNGSPRCTSACMRASSFSTNSSRTASCTSSRSPAVQLWPAHKKQVLTAGGGAAAAAGGGGARRGGVGVREHHERAVAAHLEQQRLACRALGDRQPRRRRADE